MRLHQLSPSPGAKHPKKRVGRGDGSGHGTTAGRGTKGQKARAGGGVRPGFEGGQLPLVKRLPHTRGFHNLFRTEYAVVNVAQLNRLEGDDPVTPERLHAAGLIPSASVPVKILGDGEISKALTVQAAKFSGSARSKIEAAGGHVIMPGFGIEKPPVEEPKRRPRRPRATQTQTEGETETEAATATETDNA